jgi:hypothetical protein
MKNLGQKLHKKSPNTRLINGPAAMGRILEYLNQLIGYKKFHIEDIE